MGKPNGKGEEKEKEKLTDAQEINRMNAYLKNKSFATRMFSRDRPFPTSILPPSKHLLKCDGKDIVKKGHRKNKYLFSFPGIVHPISGGKFGDLTNLDSKNPILYIEFPQGRLKLLGTIIYPKNKYITLNFQKTGNVLCEDLFESMIVFSEAIWVGKKEENPDELKLDYPTELLAMRLHKLELPKKPERKAPVKKEPNVPVQNGMDSFFHSSTFNSWEQNSISNSVSLSNSNSIPQYLPNLIETFPGNTDHGKRKNEDEESDDENSTRKRIVFPPSASNSRIEFHSLSNEVKSSPSNQSLSVNKSQRSKNSNATQTMRQVDLFSWFVKSEDKSDEESDSFQVL